jgi:hypothetical protein
VISPRGCRSGGGKAPQIVYENEGFNKADILNVFSHNPIAQGAMVDKEPQLRSAKPKKKDCKEELVLLSNSGVGGYEMGRVGYF